ncbi:MAG: nucleotidyltransferase family protein [Chloroflexi bacterium]|nr:nucleotidyltransferase family protein [Chloroflexota bacterium]
MICKHLSAIVLAAGGSSRLGRPKQLIPWRGTTLLNYTIAEIEKSGITDILLVLGASAETVQNSINNRKLRIVINSNWKSGKASSIKAGMDELDAEIEGAMIFLCDQPYISAALIRCLLKAGHGSQASIIAPGVHGKPSNPVLFKNDTFQAFSSLKGEEGGKKLFDQFAMELIPWHDERILMDVDTLEDLQRLDQL